MSAMKRALPESDLDVGVSEPPERKHYAHKRVERWIRLQQFVYGLPDDYAYAVCTGEREGRAESAVLVSVGWMTWFGRGRGSDRQHALALALLETSEAISSSGGRVFLQSIKSWIRRRIQAVRARWEVGPKEKLAS